MDENDARDKSGKTAVRVRLAWGPAEGLETIYVNHLAITHSGSEFYLLFGELPMPAFLEIDNAPEELTITPKVRLAMAPEAMKAIARAIQDNVHRSMGKEEG